MPRRPLAETPRRRAATVALVSATALAGAALVNIAQARRAERDHPPLGGFVEVDDVRLHYVAAGPERVGLIGAGAPPPVVLLHGNLVSLDDWLVSGVFDALARTHRTIAFDRPGFGYSERPRGRSWNPPAQARLLRRACRRLGIRRPVVVGHSWATLVALAWGLQAPHEVAGLVLASGYYYPGARLDAVLAAPGAVPVLGDLMAYTVSPLLTRIMLQRTLHAMFAPWPVPARFERAFPKDLIPRPTQLRAIAGEGASMVPAAAALRAHQPALRCPTLVLTGDADRIVDFEEQSLRLAGTLTAGSARVVPRAGHMVHHAAPLEVVAAVERVAS